MHEEISAWLDGELAPEGAVRLRRRLEASPGLRREHAAAADARAALRALPRIAPPPLLWDRLGVAPPPLPGGRQAGRVRAFHTARRRYAPAAAAAAVLAVVAVSSIVDAPQATTPTMAGLLVDHANASSRGDTADALLALLEARVDEGTDATVPELVLVSQP